MSDHQSALERIPHICNRVLAIWGTVELDQYITTLVFESRDGARRGLPPAAGSELMWLAEVNRWRRAVDRAQSGTMKIDAAHSQIEAEDAQRAGADVWGHANDAPQAQADRAHPARRYTDQGMIRRPRRRQTERTPVGMAIIVLTSKPVLIGIAIVLTAKTFWPVLGPLLGR